MGDRLMNLVNATGTMIAMLAAVVVALAVFALCAAVIASPFLIVLVAAKVLFS